MITGMLLASSPVGFNLSQKGVIRLFLGDNFLPLAVLAIGGALVVGPLLALVNPRQETPDGELSKAPLGRSLVQIAIGLLASVWALVTLFT